MPGEAAEVLVAKPVLVPHLYRVGPTLRQFAQEGIEVGNETPAALIVTRPEARELEHQHAHFLANGFARSEERRREQVGVQEIPIRLSGLCTETVELGKLFDGKRIGHLEAESETVRHLICQPLQILVTRKIVIRRIDANGLENLRVFAQAVTLEPG